MAFKPSELVRKRGKEGSEEEERTESKREAKREGDNPGHSAAHPGFQAVQGKIAKERGVSSERAGAILGAATRRASPAAKAANPRLKRVKG